MRLRLTLVYGVLFLVSGAGVLGIAYVFVDRAPSTVSGAVTIGVSGSGELPADGTPLPSTGEVSTSVTSASVDEQVQQQLDKQRSHLLHRLLAGSAVALAAMLLVAVVLGWVVSGRVLLPLRRVTRSVQEITAKDLHRRLAADGPHDEIRELSDTFDGLLDRLESAFDAQRRFVANASHELRSPLARQRALGEVALSDPDATVESLRDAHERILAAGLEQERIVGSLLTLAKGQHGSDRVVPVDLSALVRRVAEERRDLAREHSVAVDLDTAAAVVSGDEQLLDRLVANLVDNAVLHNVEGGHVDVLTATRNGWACLVVSNTGPLIPAEVVDRLVEPFRRLEEDRTSRRPGSGLGLSIVAAVAEANGAELSLVPRDEGGLVVEVAFRAAR